MVGTNHMTLSICFSLNKIIVLILQIFSILACYVGQTIVTLDVDRDMRDLFSFRTRECVIMLGIQKCRCCLPNKEQFSVTFWNALMPVSCAVTQAVPFDMVVK